MSLQPAQIQYLNEVLGVSAILIPEGDGPTLSDRGSTSDGLPGFTLLVGDLQATLTLITMRPLADAEKQLATKIAEATGATGYCLLECARWREKSLLDWGIQASYAIVFASEVKSGEPMDHFGVPILVIHDLQDMTLGTPEQIKRVKGQVWSQIQAFKREWKQK